MKAPAHARPLPVHVARLLALAAAFYAAGARAEEAEELLREPTGYTDVLDAFDGTDPFDLDLSLAFRRSVATATVERETVETRGGETFQGRVDVAESTHETSTLVVGAGVGLYQDLMLYARLPLVLADTRELRSIDGARCSETSTPGCDALEAPVASDPAAAAEPLFALDGALRSARRSGVPALDLGIAWAPLNQYRARHVPTWVLALESTIGTGDVMKPCLRGEACDAGVGRGTTRLAVESRWSFRYRHVEPYAGLSYAWEWATSAERRFSPAPGLADDAPPEVAASTFGAAWIPWEDRGRFQRFSIDTSLHAAWASRGQDYSPLFDALGASSHPDLTAPAYDRTDAAPARRAVDFRGLTRVDAHARLALEAAVSMRAARYVGFRLGGALRRTLPHLITGAAACNPDVEPDSPARAGACADGVINPLHRAVIDAPGRRFRLDGETTIELFGTATAMF